MRDFVERLWSTTVGIEVLTAPRHVSWLEMPDGWWREAFWKVSVSS